MFVNNATDGSWNEAASLGYAAQVLMDTDRRALSLAAFRAWVRIAIRLDQILILFGEQGNPLAFITWAYVTPETARRLGDGSGRAPFPEDWNDGTLLWIVDVVAPYGDLLTLLHHARAHLGYHDAISFAGRRTGNLRTLRAH